MKEKTIYQKLISAYDLLCYLNKTESDVEKELLDIIKDLENGKLKIIKT